MYMYVQLICLVLKFVITCEVGGLIIPVLMLSLSSPVYRVETICLALYLYKIFSPCQLSCLSSLVAGHLI